MSPRQYIPAPLPTTSDQVLSVDLSVRHDEAEVELQKARLSVSGGIE